jgi:hypothetical protein
MEPDLHSVTTMRMLEQRAVHRPCNVMDLRRLRQELEQHLAEFRQRREELRMVTEIPAESYALRSAVHSARCAISNSLAAHARAEAEIARLAELVRHGHVEVAELLHLQSTARGEFSDLNPSSVEEAVARQQLRERRLFIVGLVATGIVLGIACVVELWRRSAGKMP